MIGAHPDDETTQVLSSLALGQGAAVAYLSLTRGEGGQNGIGAELQEGLGLVRSEELLAARRLDGAQQFFTRAIDYGFSKNADEAFTNWPREELLRDVVAVVRHFRPDVIVSVFNGTPRDGHGQHQAAGIMATDAFIAAADAARFPDQIARGLRPHAVTHLFQVVRGVDDTAEARIVTGDLDPLLGQSPFQVAMASRSRHRSQDMGRILSPGPQVTGLTLAASRVGEPTSGSMFEGVDTTLFSRARSALGAGQEGDAARLRDLLTGYEATIDDARRVFNPLQPEQVVPFLTEATMMLDRAVRITASAGDIGADLQFHLTAERLEVDNALRRAARVELDAIADDEVVVPGQTFRLELQLWNGGREPLQVSALEPRLPAGWSAAAADPLPDQVDAGTLVRRRFDVTVPADAAASEPYFLRIPRDGARYAWADEEHGGVGFAFDPDEIGVTASFSVRGVPIDAEMSATYQAVEPRSGEFRRPVRVVPAVAVTVEPALAVLAIARTGQPLPLSVRLTAEEPEGIAGTLRIVAPPGWRIEPAEVALEFARPGEQRVLEFVVHAPTDLDAGRATLTAVFEDRAGRRFDRGYALVDYPHIRPQPLYRPAQLAVQAVDVVVPENLRVGYVAATGDNVPLALAQLGVAIDLLDADELASAQFDGFDVIVIGSRAYEGRADLVTHNQRLLDYVSRGGTMIVQYNQYQYTEEGIAPYPVTMARPHDRVTDENAHVRVLEPEHPLFNWPNNITDEDFVGWVQERGLYFLNTWDDRYTPLLEMADPNEDPKLGSLMVATHGSGTYVYTGLALFRQLPAGVPGAYRLFANLLALGVER